MKIVGIGEGGGGGGGGGGRREERGYKLHGYF